MLSARLSLRILRDVASAHAYFIRSEMRRNAVSCDALSYSQRYGRPHGNSTCSRNYMYAICTSHARKDRRKKSGEKAGTGRNGSGTAEGTSHKGAL